MGRRFIRMAGVAMATAALAATVAVVPAANAQSVATAKQKALSYFHSKQSAAGGFSASSSGQTASLTPWVVQAIAAAGKDPSTFKKSGGKSPIAYLQSLNIDSQATSGSGTTRNPAAFYAKMIVTYRAAKVSSLISTAGSKHVNLVKRVLAYRNSKSGCFTTSSGGSGSYAAVSTTTWAVLALKAAGYGSSQLATSASWLKKQQASSGGFSYTPGGSPDTDSTAAAIEAMRAGGVSSSTSAIKRAVSYLHSQQKANGGFTTGQGSTTNAESTAWAVQAIRAVGQSPTAASWTKSGKTPIAFMLSLQASSGAFYHYGTTLAMPLGTTAQVVVALSGKKYPF
jgi:iron complex transport system substrate-binding protein